MQKKEKKKVSVAPRRSLGKKWQKKPFKSIKVALVYDRVNKWGGAERVLIALHKIFPRAPLFTAVYFAKNAPWASVFTVKTSFLQRIPIARRYHQFFAPLMPLAFRSFSFDTYDLVISVTSEAAKGIHVSGKTKHICLCLTPTRYLWSGYEEYFSNRALRFLLFPFISLLRFLDKKAAHNPHEFLAISQEIQKRIKKYYGRESEIIYPPMTLASNYQARAMSKKKKTNGYFLVVSRLSRFTRYKRIDIAIKAATHLHVPLIVVGQGNKKYFQKYAGPSITFVDTVSDEELLTYYKHARALLFPGKEDFGLVMVEALAAGTPVIAYKAGGALEIVKEGKTGTFFPKQTVGALVSVLKSFDESRYNSQSYKENMQRFSFSYFEKTLKAYILNLL